MTGPVISFDISSGESHMQGFYSLGKPVGKAVVIKHNKEDFEQIVNLEKRIISETHEKPSAVFEFTGVYSNTLRRFVETIDIDLYGISPLISAKVRKSNLRPTKTDKKDCKTIADAFYTHDNLKKLKPIESEDDQKWESALELSRVYSSDVKDKSRLKCQYKTLLDNVWPCFDDVIAYDSNKSIEVVKAFKVPQNIKSAAQVEKVLKKFEKRGGPVSLPELAKKMYKYSKNCVSGVSSKDSPMVNQLLEKAVDLQVAKERCDNILKQLIDTVKDFEEYKLILTIPGIKENTAARLTAELGDVMRFDNAAALVAYVGIDPLISQSGKKDGKHLKISKKGNKNARCVSYIAVQNFNTHKSENIVYDFFQKKKNSGLIHKAAIIAGCNKLLRLIYHMVVYDCTYKTSK